MESTDRQVAFVTGASRGIGRLLALSLAEAGVIVVAFARSSEALEGLLDAVDDGSTIHIRSVDVTRPIEVRSAFEQAVIEIGIPSLLITCAGSASALGPISSVDPEQWWSEVTTNLRGTMLCVQAVLDPMLQADAGHIVTVYGNLGDHGGEHVSAFAAAKAGVARFTETLANELADTNVVALAIHPGFVRTPTTEHLAGSEEGRRWLPDFHLHAEHNWGDGTRAVSLVKRIIAGEADDLAGRVVHVDDDFERLTVRTRSDEDLRRLRLLLDN